MTRPDDDHGTNPRLLVGCAMWAHQPWVGRYLSPGRKGEELAEYATWCNAVEGNTTFYAEPAASTVARWAAQAPSDFRFAFKVPRTVTHDRRLRAEAHRDVAGFLRAISPLGERVGPVQLQLPPSFGPDSVETLARFVAGLPTSHRWVVELRHPAFFDGGITHRRVDDVLHRSGIGRVVLDTRPLYAEPATSEAAAEERRTKPGLPVVTNLVGDEPVVRVIGGDDVEANFAGLTTWLPEVTGWLDEGRRPFVFAHQPRNLFSPSLARRFHDAVRELRSDLAPLPEPVTVADAGEVTGQAPLF